MNLSILKRSIICLLLLPSFLFAQEDTEVTSTQKQFKDWVVQCNQVKSEKKRCVMQQQALVSNTGQRLMAVNVAKVNNKVKAVMSFTLPLGTFLPTGAQLYFDDLKEGNLRIDHCNQNGCYAVLPLSDEFIAKLKKLKQGSVVIATIANKSKPIKIPFSGKGFTKAFANLP